MKKKFCIKDKKLRSVKNLRGSNAAFQSFGTSSKKGIYCFLTLYVYIFISTRDIKSEDSEV